MVKAKFTKIIKRDGSIANFDKERITESIYRAAVEVGGRDKDLASIVSDEVVFSLNKYTHEEEYPSVEEIQDLIEKILIERGHAKTAKRFILYRANLQTKGFDKSQKHQKVFFTGAIPYQKIWNVLVWNLKNNVETIKKLNKIVSDHDKFVRLMKKSDASYVADVEAAAKRILERKDELKLVIVAGPSSSGKTTSTIILEDFLKEQGMSIKAINVDNYFHDLETHPKDEFGDYDFEIPQAIDMKLFNEHLKEMIEGKEINSPIFDFKTGTRVKDESIPLKLEQNQLILIDCLHGLFPDLTSGVKEEEKFKLYLETLAQQKSSILSKEGSGFVRWTDIRLLRRMIRDKQYRNYQPEATLTHWHYVRRSELQYIIPYINTVDHICNGALAYELPIHKTLMGENFPIWADKYKSDPERQDAYLRADRVRKLFGEVIGATKEQIDAVPKNSLFREFIGGSKRKY
ncbi:MAG: Uridine kinase [Candidatus Heimdallarchaeota archaeon LC_3]|nr:MAG: Uridine kinase [Candidatus Heimdallarchaeota archaeon LC_3]